MFFSALAFLLALMALRSLFYGRISDTLAATCELLAEAPPFLRALFSSICFLRILSFLDWACLRSRMDLSFAWISFNFWSSSFWALESFYLYCSIKFIFGAAAPVVATFEASNSILLDLSFSAIDSDLKERLSRSCSVSLSYLSFLSKNNYWSLSFYYSSLISRSLWESFIFRSLISWGSAPPPWAA